MFDIGFFELSLIGVVALVVIGPERLPSVARTAGKWLGRANRFVSNIKDDISKEIKDEELQKILQQQKDLANEFKQAAEQTNATINSLNPSEQLGGLLEIDEDNSKATKKKKKKKKKKSATESSTTDTTSSKATATEALHTENSETITSDVNESFINETIEVVAETNELPIESESIEKNEQLQQQ